MQKINNSYAKSLNELKDKLEALMALHDVKLLDMSLKQQMAYQKLITDVKSRIGYLAKYSKMW